MSKSVKSTNLKVRVYDYALEIITYIDKLPNRRAFWVIGDQLLRSATSIGANIFEGQSSCSKKEFIKYYQISLKSCNECTFWLSIIRDLSKRYRDIPDNNLLLEETDEIGKMLGASLLTLKGKR